MLSESLTRSTHLDTKAVGNMYLRNVGNTSTCYKGLREGPRSTINNRESLKLAQMLFIVMGKVVLVLNELSPKP
jgi:hypothetical protein